MEARRVKTDEAPARPFGGVRGAMYTGAGAAILAVWLVVLLIVAAPRLVAAARWLLESRVVAARLIATGEERPATGLRTIIIPRNATESLWGWLTGDSSSIAQPTGQPVRYRRYRLTDADGRVWDLSFPDRDDGLMGTLRGLGLVRRPKVGEEAAVRYRPGSPETSQLVLLPGTEWVVLGLITGCLALGPLTAITLIQLGLQTRPHGSG